MAIFQVFPHCDLHLALNPVSASSIDFRVFEKLLLDTGDYDLDDLTSSCTVQALAPHNAVGSRLESFVAVDVGAKTITAVKVGTNLLILQRGNDYIVVRIQVHDRVLAWWFGHQTMTAALDAARAHSQPSIYAMFSDDATGTDRVGDITGHGFVTLTSADPTVFDVANANKEGRLRGLKEDTADLNGSFLGVNRTIEVEVVDYAKNRDLLEQVRGGDLADVAERHNVLFLAEGFTADAADRAKFDQLVKQIDHDLFSKPRHQPYGVLAGSFNVFKAFTPSKEPLATCGFRVNDDAVAALDKGRPIPFEGAVSEVPGMYTVAELVARVGLPKRGEGRGEGALKTEWGNQSLHDFDPARVDGNVVEAWKNSHSLGLLEARDTFFGMMVGDRWADGSTGSGAPVASPAADDGIAALKAFVRRAYEFYRLDAARTVAFDPRRHAPERFTSGLENRTSAFMAFLGGLRLQAPPHQAIGGEWVPAGAFKPSRGLIAVLVNDHMEGGTSIDENTLTTGTLDADTALVAEYEPSADPNVKVLRRKVPADFAPDLSHAIDVVAHEFGHSFNLGDEYETFGGDSPTRPDEGDNLASYQSIAVDPANLPSRKIDASKVKWAVLPRIKVSSRLTAASQLAGGKLEVTIDRRETGPWELARTAGDVVHLRKIQFLSDRGRQLPLSTVGADVLTGLTLDGVDPASGKITLSGIVAGASFPAGSLLFVPHVEGGAVRRVIEGKVRAKLDATQEPLNRDKDVKLASKKPDYPVSIPDFKPPCQEVRLVGVFEGAGEFSGMVYRPAGLCKMRTIGKVEGEEDASGQFCFVCMWLITHHVDPGKHAEIDRRFYPVAKKNE